MKILDLFCGQGGMTAGLQRAGWDVTGVDRADHSSRYPGRFILGDALDYLRRHGHKYDAFTAGPPCQGYTIATAGNPTARAKYPRLIGQTRTLLQATGKPWVIENVNQARAQMRAPIMLCGRMFGLTTQDLDGVTLHLERHRLFESNVIMRQPDHPAHGTGQVAGVYGGSRRAPGEATPEQDRHAAKHVRKGGYVPRSAQVRQQLMGIDWMTQKGLSESIPPAYGEFIGRQLAAAVWTQPMLWTGTL